MKTKSLVAALLFVAVAATHAAGTQPEQIRALAKLPTMNIDISFSINSTDFGITRTNNAPLRSEAELRVALKSSPRDSAAWRDLATELARRALRDHLRTESITLNDIPRLIAAARSGELSRADINRARQLLDESVECCTKAIEAELGKSDGYLLRAAHRMMFQGVLQFIADTLDGKDSALISLMLTPDLFTDLREAARLRPDNAHLQSMCATYFLISEIYIRNSHATEKMHGTIADNLSRLETLAATNDPKIAAAACFGLGSIDFMLKGTNSIAAQRLQRAVTLDPSNERAWDLLVGAHLTAKRDDALLAVCASRVKAADTVRNRYILAKAHEQLAQLDETAAQLDIILKREPNHFAAVTGMAALALRRGDDAKADEFLSRAEKLATDSVSAEQRSDLRVLHAIRALLRNERDGAELHLGHAFKLDHENKNARAVLRAMQP